MTNLDEKLTQHLESIEDNIDFFKAPDVSKEIWRRHQLKKLRNYLAIAASTCFIIITLWVQQKPINSDSNSYVIQDLLIQNAELEQQLLSASNAILSDQQAVVITNWYHQLAMIDQNIEIKNSESFDKKSWDTRKQLLSKMVDFYIQPFDYYEI